MLHVKDGFFWNKDGARVRLRGINLSGASKTPCIKSDSYVNVPFSVEESDAHFTRLKDLGFNCIRFVVTWDAIEPTGPGIYDIGYLDFVAKLLHKAGSYGFYIIIDMHQDVFSRFFYGSGAPRWAIESAGIDLDQVVKADAVIHPVHHAIEELKHLNWFNAYRRIACQTMFTLFFGGNTFAPKLRIQGESIQDFLQDHYIKALEVLLDKLSDNPWVIGYNTMNEPNPGLIGTTLKEAHLPFDLGITPSAYQSILMGAGLPQSVPLIKISFMRKKLKGKKLLNPDQIPIWKEGCIWRAHGVYDIDENGYPQLLSADYFKRSKKMSFQQHFYRPFVLRMYNHLKTKHAHLNFFVEQEVGELPPYLSEDGIQNLVSSVHYYDPFAMVFKQYLPFFHYSIFFKKLTVGLPSKVYNEMLEDFHHIDQETKKRFGENVPTVITETGVSRDLGRFLFEGGKKQRLRAFNRILSVLDHLDMSYCIWQYSHKGDQWNHENFTIYQEGDENDYKPILRPHVEILPGTVIRQSYDPFKNVFILKFLLKDGVTTPVRVWIPPQFSYQSGSFTAGHMSINKDENVILFHPDHSIRQHHIRLLFKKV
jgi:hypothetical protein